MLRLCAIGAAALQAAAFTANPMSYGAVGDGVADDTTAVRAAAVAVAAAGGGTIAMLAPHQFLTGPFNLSSNSVLYVAAGAVLRASNDSSVYQLIPPLPWFGGGQDAEGSGQPEWSPVIASYNTTNVTITGGGLIDGNGAAWWSCFDAGLAPPPCNNYSRPQLVRPNNVTGFQVGVLRAAHRISHAHCTWVRDQRSSPAPGAARCVVARADDRRDAARQPRLDHPPRLGDGCDHP